VKGENIMEYLYNLKEKMERELREISEKPELGAGDLEIAHKLTDTIKNIDKICMLEEQGYSEDGYGRGSSYANRGKHYVRGHYSRDGGMDGGYSSRRDGRGRYSREDGTDDMMKYVRMAMESAPEGYKEDIRRFMREIENA